MTLPRRIASVAVIAVAALAFATCARQASEGDGAGANGAGQFGAATGGQPDPTGPASPASPPGPTGSPNGNPGGGNSSPAPPSYPRTARDYASALLTAWSGKSSSRIGQLATPAAVAQISGNGFPDPNWTYVSCAGAAGSTYCVFRNEHGDEVRVRLVNEQVGQANAVSEALLDRTSYPADPRSYFGVFAEAWRAGNVQRMRRLATDAVADHFRAKPAPAGYEIFLMANMGTYWEVTLQEKPIGSSRTYTVDVSKALLGKAHAITTVHPD